MEAIIQEGSSSNGVNSNTTDPKKFRWEKCIRRHKCLLMIWRRIVQQRLETRREKVVDAGHFGRYIDLVSLFIAHIRGRKD